MTAAASGRPRPRAAFWLKLAVTAGVLVILLAAIDLAALPGLLLGADPRLLLLLLVSLFVERVFAAYRWYVLVRPNAPRMPFRAVLRISFVANYLGAFLPGGVGIDALRVHGLSRYAADLPLALSSLVIERIFGLLGMLALVPLGLLMSPIDLPRQVSVLLVLAVAAILGLAICLYAPPVRRLTKRVFFRWGPLRRVASAMAGIEARLDAYARYPWTLAWSFLLGVLNQLLRTVSFVVGAWALGLSIDTGLLMAVVPIAIFVALLPISFGGIGPREATFVGLLGLAGITPESAFALILVREALNLLTALPGAWMFNAGERARLSGVVADPGAAATRAR